MVSQKKYTQEDLNNILWNAADSSRSNVDAGIYKDYALAMLFFKYLSDLSKKHHEIYKQRFGSDEQRI
ncbi:MAG TPA: type I restriction endonuclease subunit M, partial [Actinobacteria bacterium]|nr:type I restriction endonuclease subunit M [Actinomycetes bacterium]HEX21083.1 type I restriction endonuclease subunit M [Actinomycetota bacterium]